MRRLTAYKERYTQVPATATYGLLTIVEKYRPFSSTSSLTLAGRFVYNYTKYVIILSKNNGDELNASNLTAIGVATDEVVINVEMRRFKIWISTIWYLENSIAQMIASATGMSIISRSFSGTTTTAILLADTAIIPKRVTSIDINSSYIDSFISSTQDNLVYSTQTIKYDFFDLDIDDKTSIGISYEGFKPENPDQIGFKYSNAFSIPRTSNNDKLTGYGGISDDVYAPWFINYIVDNEKMVSSGKIKVTDITNDRINCSISSKATIWDKLKSDKWPDFMFEVFESVNKPANGDWSTFLQNYIDNSNGVTIRAFYGDLFGDSEMLLIARDEQYKSSALNEIVFKINGYEGGQFVIPVKKIFDRILVKYGINFISNSSVFSNISPYVQSRYFNLQFTGGALGVYSLGYYRGFSNGSTDGIKSDKSSKTVYDFVKEFIIHSGCLVDIVDDSNIALNRMDDLLAAPIVDFSGNIEKDSIKFSPSIDGIAQNNTIDFLEYSEKIQKGSLQLNLICRNQNVETSTKFLELKEFAPPAYLDRDKNVLGLFEDASWNNFTFLQDSGNTAAYNCLAYFNLSTELSATKTLPIAKIMDVGYSLWSEIIKKPKKYTIKKWLTSADLKNIKLFQRYWIQELQGYFMLLKVNGINPEKSNEATEMEFVKIPDLSASTQFTVSQTSIIFPPSASTANLYLHADDYWNLFTSIPWISSNKINGYGSDILELSVTSNSGNSIVNGIISINEGNDTINIDIKQYPLALSSQTFNFSNLGGEAVCVITTYGEWSCLTNNSWIDLSVSGGVNSGSISIYVEPTSTARTGSITITNGVIVKTITINQTE